MTSAGRCIRLLVAGCFVAPGASAAFAQVSFRVRSDFDTPLNADAGWAGKLNEDVAIHADEPFRLRFEVERNSSVGAGVSFRMEYRRNGGDWAPVEAHDFPHPETDDAKTPRVSIVSCAAFTHGAPTTNVLAGSSTPFQPGAGVALADRTPPWPGDGHTEFEWALVVRRFADGAVTNEPGDTFEFRLAPAEDAPPARIPKLRLQVRPGHVGGTFVETPGRIGPWRSSNGNLYFIMEPAETSNLFLMIKSEDGGRTWREVDGANRPPTRDLESVDSRLVGDTIHIVHQVTRSVRYHSFRTSDHPTRPDTWDVRAEEVGAVPSVAQAASLVVRSDGSMVAFYVGQTRIHYSIRGPSGRWREAGTIDGGVGPQAVLGADDTVHLAYYRVDGTIWHRRLLRDGTLTAPEQLAAGLRTTRAEFGSVLPLNFMPETRTVSVTFRQADGLLWERRIIGAGQPGAPIKITDHPVVQNAVDSQQPGADAVSDGAMLHLLFIEQASRSIFSTSHAAGWQPPILQVDRILGSWVRGNIYTRADGVRVYGYVYDAGSDGGAGMNRFAEVVLAR